MQFSQNHKKTSKISNKNIHLTTKLFIFFRNSLISNKKKFLFYCMFLLFVFLFFLFL